MYEQQDYFLARPAGRAFKTMEEGTIAQQGQVYPKGAWFINLKWFAMHSFNEHGVRVYRISQARGVELWPVASLEVGGSTPVKFTKCRGGAYYDLSLSMHEMIMKYGKF